MTRKKLRNYIWVVTSFLIVYAVALAVTFFTPNEQVTSGSGTQPPPINRLYGFLKDLIPVALAVPLAFLTSILQRRISYIQALRDLYKQLLPAIQSAIQYTYLVNPKQPEFAKVYADLSLSIDLLRSVFRNTKERLYPYENLKDILEVIKWLGFGEYRRTADEYHLARKTITRLWQEMYNSMLREFDRDVPSEPVSKYLHTKKSIADHLFDGTLTDKCLEKGNKPSHGCEEKKE
jgi:hypothetical protein